MQFESIYSRCWHTVLINEEEVSSYVLNQCIGVCIQFETMYRNWVHTVSIHVQKMDEHSSNPCTVDGCIQFEAMHSRLDPCIVGVHTVSIV